MTDLPCASANREISHRGGGYGREHGLSFGERRFVGLSFGHQHLAGFQYVCATPLFYEIGADPRELVPVKVFPSKKSTTQRLYQ